jgi:DNA-binding XRE family transcriptional regulator
VRIIVLSLIVVLIIAVEVLKMVTYPKLKAAMAEHGIKNLHLANHLKLNISTVCYKLNGKRPFTLNEAKAIADYFGKTIDEIFFG